ncbi:hypothetical protein KIW84_064887 [Lathyrus oleraceus]|uniref:Uncharacterized protein n=1 Tax=Pisum sativum TaxID=3888 RepID=A0A9D4WFI5_PEA|nr:hypothetical protein KIW84_064887 [Pisum sativum]
MDHLVTSSCILSTKHLLAQPLISCDCPFPQNAKIFVKALQSMMLKAVLPVWTHPQLLARQSEPCEPYNICTNSGNCSCPSVLLPSCKLGFVSPGGDDKSEKSIEFLKADDGLSYFSLDFLPPYSNTDLIRCQTSYCGNCSCLEMIFHTSSRNCFLFDSVIYSQKFNDTNSGYVSYIKFLKPAKSDYKQVPVDDTGISYASSICAAPLYRQFWKAGRYDDGHGSQISVKKGKDIRPKLLPRGNIMTSVFRGVL